MAGFFLTVAGFLRIGTYIKFIPYPVTVGFTAGIAVIIFASQIKDLFGLTLSGKEPGELVAKLDALTGAFDRIDFRSTGGQGLKDKWKREGLQTFLGVEVPGFPNMFMLMGPHTALGNIPRSIEHNVEWVTGLIKHMRERKLTRAECKVEAAKEWTDHVIRIADGLLSMEIDSWMTGINRNVEGKDTRSVARYTGSAPAYRERADAVAAGGYREHSFA